MAFRRSIQSGQRRERRELIEVDADASSPVILVGGERASLVRNGAGDYTLTLSEPFNRACSGVATGLEDNAMCRIGSRTLSTIQVLVEDASSNAAADLDFVIDIVGWDAEDES